MKPDLGRQYAISHQHTRSRPFSPGVLHFPGLPATKHPTEGKDCILRIGKRQESIEFWIFPQPLDREEVRFHGLCTQIRQNDIDLWLLEPQTFMNRSGQAVVALCQFYKILPDEIIVVHDELDLPPGIAKLKKGGGLGGHNGLKDIAARLGTQDFWRLRIGIGHPRNYVPAGQEPVDYVLHAPRAEEQEAMDKAMSRALDVWSYIVTGDMEGAMLRLHSKPNEI